MEHNIEEKEHVELLLQSLPNSYDHLIINTANGALRIMLVFNDIVTTCWEPRITPFPCLRSHKVCAYIPRHI